MWPFSSKTTLCKSDLLGGATDCHTHLLPGVDDGFRTADDSLAALSRLESTGIRTVWLTPHIMEDIPNETDDLRRRFEEFAALYTGPIELHLAAEHMLDNLKPGHKMALFLKLQFLEGQDRYKKVFSRKQLKTVYLYTKRVACYKNNEMYQRNEDGTFKLDKDGNKMKIPSAVAYAWYIFESGYQGDPVIKWISNK